MPDLLTRLDLRGASGDLRDLLPAPEMGGNGPLDAVRSILDAVREGGDKAIAQLTERFDGVLPSNLRVPQEEITSAVGLVDPELCAALTVAAESIAEFHRTQLHPSGSYTRGGLVVEEIVQPVGRAGCYVPGGRAALASSLLMTAVPARVAGVPEVVVCSPPGPDGKVSAVILAAAAIAGVNEVYAVGGAQAIAAMAYGTSTIRPVDVIVGPGNVYVALAQRIVSQQGAVGVPSAFAGPSEVVVIADETTPVEFAAIDLVVQAEHGPDGLAWLVTWSEETAAKVGEAVERIVKTSPRRNEITSTLERGGWTVLVEGPEQALEVANVVAAEHLELMCAQPEKLLGGLRNAGAVFCGPWAPASVGDYVAGPSHVLPTARSARYSSALGVADFYKLMHVITLDKGALLEAAPHVAALAKAEGLAAHADSVLLRAQDR